MIISLNGTYQRIVEKKIFLFPLKKNFLIQCLDRNEDEPIVSETTDDQRRFFNGNRMPSSSSNFEAHRGDDFYKKLMFYEKNS